MEAAARGRLRIGLLLVAIALLAFQLRSPLVALAPVAAQAQRDWAVTPAAFGLLTTVPLLCFGLATPIAPWLARRIGVEGAIEVGIGGIVVATVLRSIDGFGVAIASAVLLGLAITIGNVLVPTVIRRDVPARGRVVPSEQGGAEGCHIQSCHPGSRAAAIRDPRPRVGAMDPGSPLRSGRDDPRARHLSRRGRGRNPLTSSGFVLNPCVLPPREGRAHEAS